MLDCDDSIALVHVQDQPSKAPFSLFLLDIQESIQQNRSKAAAIEGKKCKQEPAYFRVTFTLSVGGVLPSYTSVFCAHLSLLFRSGDNEREKESGGVRGNPMHLCSTHILRIDRLEQRGQCIKRHEGKERGVKEKDDDNSSSR